MHIHDNNFELQNANILILTRKIIKSSRGVIKHVLGVCQQTAGGPAKALAWCKVA